MDKVHYKYNRYSRKCSGNLLFYGFIVLLSVIVARASEQSTALKSPLGHIENALIVTQIPPASYPSASLRTKNTFRPGEHQTFLRFGEGARLVKVKPDSSVEELSRDFHSACDPAISFDASHILFAGKRTPDDDWNIYEMDIDGTNVRQITHDMGNCRSPDYQAMLYTIVSPEPWYQLTFVCVGNKVSDEYNAGATTNLYSCKLDGSEVRRLTFNLTDNMDPFIMPDGRLLFSSRHSSLFDSDSHETVTLFGINIDGTDYAAFHTEKGRRIKCMPCTTSKGLVVFIESDQLRWDRAGNIGRTLLRRPLHSYRSITKESDGLFLSPSPLADSKILVSRKLQDDADTYGVYRLDPSTEQLEVVFDSPEYHDLQAKMVYSRPEPDGRSSVVTEKDPNGKVYCLDVYISDFDKPEWMPRGTVKRLRVLEGSTDIFSSNGSREETTPVVLRRILGEIDIEEDGSFNIEIPANTPIELQTLDADGMALRSCGWIWARNHEPRGCIGCHEDGELTPENILINAVLHPSVKLNLPIEQRRTVGFQRDVIPIISKKCVQCHGKSDSVFKLADDSDAETIYKSLLTSSKRPGYGKYVHPGRARTSPLVWHIFGRNTSRPWDDTFSQQEITKMPPTEEQKLTADEKRTLVEWIDMGALWDGISVKQNNGGSSQ